MDARANDPILSADRKTIVAKWRVGLSLKDGNNAFTMAVLPDLATAQYISGLRPETSYYMTPRVSVTAIASFPDRTYWQLVDDCPVEWLHERNQYFSHPDADTEPSNPRGMVAAIDELLNRNHPTYEVSGWLSYIRDYYQSHADREARRA